MVPVVNGFPVLGFERSLELGLSVTFGGVSVDLEHEVKIKLEPKTKVAEKTNFVND
jgi:hypothetical protein